MRRLRFGWFLVAGLAAALLVRDRSGKAQTYPVWQRANLTAVDRDVTPAALTPPPRRGRQRGQVEGIGIGRGGAAYQPGRLIVRFRPGMSTPARASALSQIVPSATFAPRAPNDDVDIVTFDPLQDAEDLAAALRSRADVVYAQPSYRVWPYFTPNDPRFSLQWNFPAIDLQRAWDIQKGASSSIVVAVIDTGMAFQSGFGTFHGFAFCSGNERSSTCSPSTGPLYPALGDVSVPFARAPDLADSSAGVTGDGRFVAPHDFIWNNSVPVDLDGHGTHVSGTIGQLTNNGVGVAGVAFNVRLMPLKAISSDWDDIFHSPFQGTDDIVATAIDYAVAHGAKVLNMSIGRGGPAGSAPLLEDALRRAVANGCFVAIAGGNEGDGANSLEVFAEIASRIQGVVSVAATDRKHGRAFYSTTGSWIELAAPGGSIDTDPFGGTGLIFQQTYNLQDFVDTFEFPVSLFIAPRFDMMALEGLQGTSMATPHVAGLAALLMQQGITNPAAIEAALEKFATPCSESQNKCDASIAPNRNNSFGFGEINARNTLRGLGLR